MTLALDFFGTHGQKAEGETLRHAVINRETRENWESRKNLKNCSSTKKTVLHGTPEKNKKKKRKSNGKGENKLELFEMETILFNYIQCYPVAN